MRSIPCRKCEETVQKTTEARIRYKQFFSEDESRIMIVRLFGLGSGHYKNRLGKKKKGFK